MQDIPRLILVDKDRRRRQRRQRIHNWWHYGHGESLVFLLSVAFIVAVFVWASTTSP